MVEFKDSEGRRWTIRLTLGDVKRVMDTLGVNLLNLSQFADKSADGITARLISDDLFVAEIIGVLLAPQAEKYGVDVMTILDGATMKAAQEAFFAEYAFFFKDRGNATAQKFVEEVRKAKEAILTGATSVESLEGAA